MAQDVYSNGLGLVGIYSSTFTKAPLCSHLLTYFREQLNGTLSHNETEVMMRSSMTWQSLHLVVRTSSPFNSSPSNSDINSPQLFVSVSFCPFQEHRTSGRLVYSFTLQKQTRNFIITGRRGQSIMVIWVKLKFISIDVWQIFKARVVVLMLIFQGKYHYALCLLSTTQSHYFRAERIIRLGAFLGYARITSPPSS